MALLSKKKKKKKYPSLPKQFKWKVPPPSILDLMSLDLMKEFKAYVVGKNKEHVKIAALDPDDKALRTFVKERFGKNIFWYQLGKEDLEYILKTQKVDFKKDISGLVTRSNNGNGYTVSIVEKIIAYALSKKVSDVHVEPERTETVVRFRVDGVLHKVISLPKEMHIAVVARFKILANLKIDEYRRPQDGRIEPEGFSDTSLRISTIPTLHGEKVVLRVLDDSHKNLVPQILGFSEGHIDTLMNNVNKPFGMIVASGPTGSGKTTTLYALLNLLKKDGINISTLEEPIEYALKGVNQIHVRPNMGLTFSSGLRSLLRQDPDVIMVGEIRDTDTIVMASEAALTGHLVLTTMHTNDAPSALIRFLEMKVDDFVASSIVNLIVAQRLVRKVCDKCAKQKKLSAVVLKRIKERKDVLDLLEKQGKPFDKISKQKFTVGEGCEHCLGTGYRDRVGIFELLETNKEIGELILGRASSEKIKAVAEKHGFKDMLYDGLDKIFNGTTTFEEVLRTTRNS
jgi:type II secretory ATPase GspE/PulE/Tfp pilus assembly ATPase PilB-like protein